MAITLLASLSVAPGTNGGTSAAIDTTGATLLVVIVGWYGGGTMPVLSDSKTNTYTGTSDPASGGNLSSQRVYYKVSPVVGTGHTFTLVSSSSSPVMHVYAFSNVASYETHLGVGQLSGASLPTGSITPTKSGALFVSGICGINAVTDTITPAGFTVTTKGVVPSVNMQGSAAWYVQTTAAAVNATWNFSPSQGNASAHTIVFLSSDTPPASGGGRGTIGAGVVTSLVQNQIYALAPQICHITSTSSVEISADGVTFTALVNAETTGARSSGVFIRTLNPTCQLIAKVK